VKKKLVKKNRSRSITLAADDKLGNSEKKIMSQFFLLTQTFVPSGTQCTPMLPIHSYSKAVISDTTKLFSLLLLLIYMKIEIMQIINPPIDSQLE